MPRRSPDYILICLFIFRICLVLGMKCCLLGIILGGLFVILFRALLIDFSMNVWRLEVEVYIQGFALLIQ